MAFHPFRTLAESDTLLVQWCPHCGTVRDRRIGADGKARTSVYAPRAYEQVGKTTCAAVQEDKDERD